LSVQEVSQSVDLLGVSLWGVSLSIWIKELCGRPSKVEGSCIQFEREGKCFVFKLRYRKRYVRLMMS
jgi:hypothetical protein